MDNYSRKVQDFYSGLTMRYGDSAEANAFSRDAQEFRWDKILEMYRSVQQEDEKCSVLDFGCGTGDLYEYMKSNLKGEFFYTGIDIVPEMIQIAQAKIPEYDGEVYCKDVVADGLDDEFDWIFINGIFNMNISNEKEAVVNMKRILRLSFECCRKGIIFNFISKYVNWVDKEMNYFDPFFVAQFCVENLSRKIRLEHHYNKCDVCIMVLK